MSGFYANELLLKLLPRNDPHPVLFDAYAALLARLSMTRRSQRERYASSKSACWRNSAGDSTSSTNPAAARRSIRAAVTVTASMAGPSRSMEWRREP